MLASREKVGTAQLSIQVAPGPELETTASYIPVPSGSGLALVEIHSAVVQVSALCPTNGSGIPIAARKEDCAVLFNGMH